MKKIPDEFKEVFEAIARKKNAMTRKTSVKTQTYPCIYRDDTGPKIGEATCAEGCAKGTRLPVRSCGVHGKCVVAKKTVEGYQCCRDCTERVESVKPSYVQLELSPDATRIDLPEGHFNGSIIEWQGRILLSSRNGNLTYLSELDSQYRPIWTKNLVLNHPSCRNGAEDARLYLFKDRVRMSFAGIWSDRKNIRIRQCWTELDSNLKPMEIHSVEYKDNKEREKNWGFFEGPDGDHLAVYSISPHIILRIDGNRAEEIARTTNLIPWNGGHLRGGAPPVRTGDTYTVWMHGNLRKLTGRVEKYVYSSGAYEFEAVYPYRVIRQTIEPVQWARSRDRTPDRPTVEVIFPVGAIRQGDKWIVSQGSKDEAVEIVEHSHPLMNEPERIPDQIAKELDLIQELPGWCLRDKAEELVRHVLRVKPQVCVEVGVFGGRSLLPVASALRYSGSGIIYGIDPWDDSNTKGTMSEPDRKWWSEWNASDTHRKFLSAVDSLGLRNYVRVIQTTSMQAAKIFDTGSIDFLYIDGNHSPESSMADARMWWPRLKSGGVLWFDDSDWPTTQSALKWLDKENEKGVRSEYVNNDGLGGRCAIYKKA